eukprot:scaffold338_cov116-Cylindrotheca_fusiformis.AAC.17
MSKRIGFAVTAMMVLMSLVVPRIILNQTELPKKPTEAKEVTEYYYPRVCNEGFEATWIMFIGDSNMRHTYFWWTQRYREDERYFEGGATFGSNRKDLDYGGRWADQELLYNAESCKEKMDPLRAGGTVPAVVRFSFRFLHGRVDELVDIPRPWDVARIGDYSPGSEDYTASDGDIFSNATGSGKPSDYAIKMTKHKKPVGNNSTKFNRLMKLWTKKKSPDIVILAHGWGGTPTIDHVDVVKEIVRENPDTLFVWAPMYITDRSPERYSSFLDAGAFQWSGPNLHMVDLWNLTKLLPYSKNESETYHAPIGGSHMNNSMKILWEATKCRNYTS